MIKKLDYTIIFCAFAILILLCVATIILFCKNYLPSSAPHAPQHAPQTKAATQKTTRTTDLLQLQLSKEQVESSSFEGRASGSALGNVGYVQGSSEGKPVTYIYIRYRAENGDIIDRLIPRDQVRLRDDLAPNAPATVEIDVVKSVSHPMRTFRKTHRYATMLTLIFSLILYQLRNAVNIPVIPLMNGS